ncbi:MAG TPA: TfoX/Sxy family protein [Aeromicrobium sp.]|nr:TfoX/Sxy family protein [Aeromicrobium sp.]
MAYDETLAARIRDLLADRDSVMEKKMFGGLAFLIAGNMAVAASGQGGIMVRCDPAETDDHVVDGAEPFVMRGKPMNGWLRVSGERVEDDAILAHWVQVGLAAAASLPAK